jgi:sugar (pentulose or hexulose) kinase
MTSAAVTVAAVDLGASSGRVMAGRVDRSELALQEVHRFSNDPVAVAGTLYWDILRLYAEVRHGLLAAARDFPLASAGIDSWGVDYGLLDEAGALVGNPVHYRDARTTGVALDVPEAELYAATGIQHLPFNTIYQLAAAAGTPSLAAARTLLLIPDLLAYWLTGMTGAEVTNASTTSLLDVATGQWAAPLMKRAGISPGLFPPLRQPGEVIGPVTGLPGEQWPSAPLIAVASHDTASAVAAVPAAGRAFAYISSGTWSLAGMELDTPVLTEASRLANFTNEAGIDATIRYLRNVMGLWLLQESLRWWARSSRPVSLADVLADAARLPPLRSVIDPDDPAFLPPGDMPERIALSCRQTGQPVPRDEPETVRCILDSLALAYRRAIRQAQELSGRHADVVHIVGGGAQNTLLCQLTADACGLPVVAGPVEGAAIGNVLVQARALGAAPADLDGMRALVRGAVELRQYHPSGENRSWSAAARRVGLES